MKKVYCEDCCCLDVFSGRINCYHKNNMDEKSDWRRKSKKYKNMAYEINKNNDCIWFTEMDLFTIFRRIFKIE